MAFELPALPYQTNALEPYMSEKTLGFHYGKHHKAYVDNLNKFIENTVFAKMPLEQIISETFGKPEYTPIFNNAAQTWNHTFFWNSMKPAGGGLPCDELLRKIERDFGSFDKFREEFKNAAASQFGSGWAWLVEKDDKLSVLKTSNADTPIAHGLKPIVVIDVWEHAYYLDYQNLRANFIDAYLGHLVKW
ncbi:MAG: superoxide dismutase [Lactobacillaceae bacterium]|jgi:Fe-Mn family superoxide dismutase|nr:superoxide dismutase [Lactobacillaceae bacterium]